MLVIGLTGGIGSGKTQVSDWFAKQGVTVIDADVLSRQVVKKNTPTLQKIVDIFGDWVLTQSGELDRRLLREYVFNNPNALTQLETIIHPAIRDLAVYQLSQVQSDYAILVVPLLLENQSTGLASLCQRVLVVDCDEQLQLARASLRDGQTYQNIQAIMAKQLPRKQRLNLADDVVDNNQSFDYLYEQLIDLHQKYLNLAKNDKNMKKDIDSYTNFL